MDKLRKSFRSSFRKKISETRQDKEALKSWPGDEAAVRSNTCKFDVKYLGSVEVTGARGTDICEEALAGLLVDKRKATRCILHVSGDGLRVVDVASRDLILDQIIEKVSFCAPGSREERAFTYICREGTSKRWMCHGFISLNESGERLSHAVGFSFAICLERKEKRLKEAAVISENNSNGGNITRLGSYRPARPSIQDRKVSLENLTVGAPPPVSLSQETAAPSAVARPRPSELMFQRQASHRGFARLKASSPFKRQASLRIDELPSYRKPDNSYQPASSSPIEEELVVLESLNVNTADSTSENRNSEEAKLDYHHFGAPPPSAPVIDDERIKSSNPFDVMISVSTQESRCKSSDNFGKQLESLCLGEFRVNEELMEKQESIISAESLFEEGSRDTDDCVPSVKTKTILPVKTPPENPYDLDWAKLIVNNTNPFLRDSIKT